MSGQSAMKSVKETKAMIKGIECNNQMSGSKGAEMGSTAKPSARPIGKK
jgi:hypothetical protein